MSVAKSRISWCGPTWNPTKGCSHAGSGCSHCYAERQARRLVAMGKPGYEGVIGPDGKWTGRVNLHAGSLDQPLRWRKPQVIFVNSMSDLFHESLSDRDIGRVFAMMAKADWHTYLVLTKRPERMRDWSAGVSHYPHGDRTQRPRVGWPSNVWLGVSIWDQESADRMIPWLLETPAAHRFVSLEPLLGPVNLCALNVIKQKDGDWPYIRLDALRGHVIGPDDVLRARLDQVIVGGETGPGARPCDVSWVRSIVEQCQAASVPCHVKQLGERPIDSALADIVCNGQVHYVRPDADTMCHEASVRPGYTVRPHEMARLQRNRRGADPSEWPADLQAAHGPGSLAWMSGRE